jgi:uncharacterized protein
VEKRQRKRTFLSSDPKPTVKLDNKVLFILLAIFFISITSSAGVEIPAQPANYVVDLAGIIDSPTEATLNKYLLELEQKSTSQMIVLTIKSLEGEQIEEFSLRTAHDTWKLGQEGKDNGVLLLIAHQDRKYRFEIGYGLEELLPDSYVGTIGRQFFVPNFTKGKYSHGIALATIAVINPIASNAGIKITGMPKSRVNNPVKNKLSDLFIVIPGVLFFLYIFYAVFKYSFTLKPHGQRYRNRTWLYGSSFGGSVGGFGGGSGGFGGGGGGGFGGAGATGGW